MSNPRCEYCGRTVYELSFVFNIKEAEEVLCRCHGHCRECKLLVKDHKSETDKPTTFTKIRWDELT